MLWLKVAGSLLAFSGAVFLSMVLAMGFSVLEALGCVIVLLIAIWILMNREVQAPDLVMRESLWNTPEDDDEVLTEDTK